MGKLKKQDKKFLTKVTAGIFIAGGVLANPDLASLFNSVSGAGAFVIGGLITTACTAAGAFGLGKLMSLYAEKKADNGFVPMILGGYGLILGAVLGFGAGYMMSDNVNDSIWETDKTPKTEQVANKELFSPNIH